MEPPRLSNRKLDQLSAEELLKVLENSEIELNSVELPTDEARIVEFLERFNFKSGKHKVKSKLLYKLFTQYYPALSSCNAFTEIANNLLTYKNTVFYLNVEAKYVLSLLVKKTKPKSKLKTFKPQAHLIAFFNDIQNGTSKIPWFALYHLYREFCAKNGIKKAASKKVFLRYTNMFFKSVINNDGAIFLVDKVTAHSIPKKDYEQLKRIYEKENNTPR